MKHAEIFEMSDIKSLIKVYMPFDTKMYIMQKNVF